MKKLFLLTIAFIFSCNFIFGQTTYKTVYKCGFEDSENISNWYLQNALEYESQGKGDNLSNLFYIGTADAYSGTKSLYTSEDNGTTNTSTIPTHISEIKKSIADLNIRLSVGNYILSFALKNPFKQNIFLTILKDRFDYTKWYIAPKDIDNFYSSEWTIVEIPFTIPEEEEVNWINFWYVSFAQKDFPLPTIEGLAIDNIVIKKDVGQPIYNVSGVVTNNDVAVTSGRVYLYDVETMSKYTLVDSARIENDGSYIFEAFSGAYIMKAESPNTENAVPTYYGDSVNWKQAKVVKVINNAIDNLDIVLATTDELGGGHGIIGTVEEDDDGKSLNKSKRPAANVDIRLEKQGIVIAQSYTNAQGSYEFRNVAQGKYKVIIDIPGLPMISTHEIEVNGADNDIENINYTVTKSGIVKSETVGVVETDNYSSLRIYPNPVNETLYFSNETAFEIIDLQGKVLLKNENAVKFVDISHFKAGIYFVKIDNQIQKLIKR